MRRTLSLLTIFAFLVFYSCGDDPVDPDLDKNLSVKGIFILNEGNYGYGNASLSFYEPDSFRVNHNIFQKTNGFPPGDVLQSMIIRDSLAFMTVSNSGKILIFHIRTFEHLGTITGLTAPRYMEFISAGKAVVSDLHSPYLAVINIQNYTIEDQIYVGAGTEQLTVHGEFLFAASWSFSNKIFRISIPEMTVKDSLLVGIQPNSMLMDANDKLWVLCDGGYPGNSFGHERARLVRIDPVGFSIEKEFIFENIDFSPTELCSNQAGDTLYFLNGGWAYSGSNGSGVFRMPAASQYLPDLPLIAQDDHLFYGLGIDPLNSEIYCSDAIDYLQKGLVFRYSAYGIEMDRFHAGIIPGFFAFR